MQGGDSLREKLSNTLTGKAGALKDFLLQYGVLQSFLHTNMSSNQEGTASINTIYGENWERKYLGGHGIKIFDFALSFILPQDTGTSDNNAKQFQIVQNFMDWIDEQEQNKNYPIFDGCTVLSIENLQNMPNFAGVDESGGTAKYMFQCRVRYYE